MARTVLCFGDSNTWGFDPASKGRFPPDVRWTGVLQTELGGEYRILEEGLNGRTTVWDDPIEEYRNGKAYLIPCLDSHRPLDLVVLMLGVNDLKKRFSVSALDVGRSVGLLLDVIARSGAGPDASAPRALLLCPAPFGKLTELAEMFEGAAEKSGRLARYYEDQARVHGAEFLDTGGLICSSDLDGIHYEAAEHRKLGRAVAQKVREVLH